MSNEWIDISQPLSKKTAPWPGDTPFQFDFVSKRETGSVNIGSITTSVHLGTHVDAPFHVDEQGKKIHELPLDVYIGPAKIIDVTGYESIGIKELKPFDLDDVTRLLLKTTHTNNPEVFPENFTYVRAEAGAFLRKKGIRLLGVDVPSVDPLDSKEMKAHHSLFSNGVYILENLMLAHAAPGNYELIALPLAIQGADGSPVRAVIRRLKRSGLIEG